MDGTRGWGSDAGRVERPGAVTAAPRRGRRWIVAASVPLLAATLLVGFVGPQPAAATCGSLQSRINAAHAGSTLRLTGCTFWGRATVSKRLTIVGGTIHVPARQIGLTIKASGVTIWGVRIVGSTKTTYRAGEYGIVADGSAGSPIRHLTIRGSTIWNLGDSGIFAKHVAGLLVSGNHVHDVVYGGIIVISGQTGRIEKNVVQRIGLHGSAANSGNAYGIVLTDQGGPVTSNFVVTRNTVEDVRTWHAFDTHGGRTLTFAFNTVRRSMRAFFITTNGNEDRPTGITISRNRILSPSPVRSNVVAVTLYRAATVRVISNTISGWGTRHPVDDYGNQSTGVVISGNVVHP